MRFRKNNQCAKRKAATLANYFVSFVLRRASSVRKQLGAWEFFAAGDDAPRGIGRCSKRIRRFNKRSLARARHTIVRVAEKAAYTPPTLSGERRQIPNGEDVVQRERACSSNWPEESFTVAFVIGPH